MDFDSESELPDINTLYWHLKDSEGLDRLNKTDDIVFKPPQLLPAKKKTKQKLVYPATNLREKKDDDISNKA